MRHARPRLGGLRAALRQIRETMAGFATKADLAEREVRLVKWVLGAMLAQTAAIVALATLLR